MQEVERVRAEEHHKLQQQDAYNKQEVAKYNNQLATQRAEADHEKQRTRNQELVQLQVPYRMTRVFICIPSENVDPSLVVECRHPDAAP